MYSKRNLFCVHYSEIKEEINQNLGHNAKYGFICMAQEKKTGR